MGADTSKMVGRVVVLEYCANPAGDKPVTAEWKPAGAMTTKSWDFSPNTVTSEADDTAGFQEGLVTNSDFSISGDGEWRKSDRIDEIGINALVALYTHAMMNREQPTVWVRLKYGSMTMVGKMNITGLSSEAPTNEITTFSVEFKLQDAATLEISYPDAIAQEMEKLLGFKPPVTSDKAN